MPRMSELELKGWRDKLDYSHSVWKEHGVTSDPVAPFYATVSQLLDAYRGRQWGASWGGLDREDLVTVNFFFSVTNTILAQLSSRNPKVTVVPRNDDSVDAAPKVEALLNYYAQEMMMRREFNAALRDALFMPWGVVRHGFTPRREYFDADGNLLETYSPSKPDLPWIRQIPLWDVRVDPLARTLRGDDDARWCAFRSMHLLDDVRRNPAFITRQDLRATHQLSDGYRRPREMKQDRSPEANQLVEVWTFYDKIERKFFALSPGSEKPLREPADWPIAWEGLPLDMLGFNEQSDDPFPVPYLDQLYYLQLERNRVRTMMSELVKRMRRILFVHGDRLDETERAKLFTNPDLVEFIETEGNPADVVNQVQMGGFSQDLLAYDQLIKEDGREMIGQSNMDRAQRINVQSATEAANVQLGSDTQRSRNQVVFEEFLSGVVANFAKGLQATVNPSFIVPILGETDARLLAAKPGVPFLRATPAEIQGEFSFQIVVGSTLPETQDRDLQREIGWLAVAEKFPSITNLPQALADVARAARKNPSKALLSNQEIAQTQKNMTDQGIPPGTPESAGQIDPNAFAALLRGGTLQ